MPKLKVDQQQIFFLGLFQISSVTILILFKEPPLERSIGFQSGDRGGHSNKTYLYLLDLDVILVQC